MISVSILIVCIPSVAWWSRAMRARNVSGRGAMVRTLDDSAVVVVEIPQTRMTVRW
jgi:hypothetical protein